MVQVKKDIKTIRSMTGNKYSKIIVYGIVYNYIIIKLFSSKPNRMRPWLVVMTTLKSVINRTGNNFSIIIIYVIGVWVPT